MGDRRLIIDEAPLTLLPRFESLVDWLTIERRKSSRMPCGRFTDGAVDYLGYQLDWFLATGELVLYVSPQGRGVILMDELDLFSPAGRAVQELVPDDKRDRVHPLDDWLPTWEWLGHGLEVEIPRPAAARGGPPVEFRCSSQLLYG